MTVKTPSKAVDMKVASILISQPKPETEKSPYFDLAKRHNIEVDFRPFIQVEGVDGRDVRKARINPLEFSSVIFNSRNSIDHYFRICDEFRTKVSQETKFFCLSEAIALYLQKYTQYRKRKVFYGNGSLKDFYKVLLKYKDSAGRVLYPCSDKRKSDIEDFLTENGFEHKAGVIYRTVAADLTDLEEITYDMIVFFSPSGLVSLQQNFPNFEQKNTRIAAFGSSTAQAVEDAGFTINIKAPSPESPSMTMAIDKYLQKVNG